MPTAEVSFRVTGLGPVVERIKRARAIARDPMRHMAKGLIEIDRAQIAKEFRGGYYLNPSGGRTSWKPVGPFGSRPAPPGPLGGANGGLARAWAGGAGGYTRVTARTYTVGVRHPGASAHRGGTGSKPQVGLVTRIRARRILASGQSAMRMFLGLTFGVWISDAKLTGPGLALPARPHAASHPEGRRLKVAHATSIFTRGRR